MLDAEPDFYLYSARIGVPYSENNSVYAQEVHQYGLGKTILL
jgi:hypothetical protein